MAVARDYFYTLDRDGRLWHDGTEIVDPAILRLYLKTLEEADDDPDLDAPPIGQDAFSAAAAGRPSRFRFHCKGELNHVHPEDTPYVVRDVEVRHDQRGAVSAIELRFAAGYGEALDPTTLSVGADHVLYARVRGGRFAARFTRPAYYRLAELIEQRARGFVLVVAGREHPIARPATVRSASDPPSTPPRADGTLTRRS